MQSPEAIRAQQEAFLSMLRQSIPPQDQGLQPDISAPNNLQVQQDAFRTMLRANAQDQPTQQPDEDPTLKLLNSLMGAMPGGDPNAAPGPAQPAPGFSPAAIASMLGVPPVLANMLGGATPTEAEQKSARVWKTLHTVFALAVAGYLLFVIGSSVAVFGSPPPKPATAQNPFAIFATGELLLTGSKVLFGGKTDAGMVVQLFKDVMRDGSVVLFMLGMGTWYNREWITAH